MWYTRFTCRHPADFISHLFPQGHIHIIELHEKKRFFTEVWRSLKADTCNQVDLDDFGFWFWRGKKDTSWTSWVHPPYCYRGIFGISYSWFPTTFCLKMHIETPNMQSTSSERFCLKIQRRCCTDESIAFAQEWRTPHNCSIKVTSLFPVYVVYDISFAWIT